MLITCGVCVCVCVCVHIVYWGVYILVCMCILFIDVFVFDSVMLYQSMHTVY